MDILQEAFLKASTKNCKSIAIPALGTGFLNYPATTVAKCMYDAVINWQSNKPRTQLKSFTFVLYSKNTEVMQVGLKIAFTISFADFNVSMRKLVFYGGKSLKATKQNMTTHFSSKTCSGLFI